jgi:hypothetical protein
MRNYLIGALVLGLTTASQASILTFDGLGVGDYGDIPTTYGDAYSATYAGPGTLGLGNGYTPDIEVGYSTVDGTGTQTSDHLDFWTNNYGDLTNIAYPVSNGNYGRITLTPGAGKDVILNSFDFGSYIDATRTFTRLHVMDSNGADLWSAASLLHPSGDTHVTHVPAIQSSGAITIEWGTDWDLGIDNVNFDQVDTVPEPATMLALAAGLAAISRRRKA